MKPSPFLVAGIVNITPDSFSDGGQFAKTETAVDQIYRLLADGAHLIDLGAESTRPGATSIGHDEEWKRLEPVLLSCRSLEAPSLQTAELVIVTDDGTVSDKLPFGLCIDTFRASTARRALECSPGVVVINDVAGGTFDEKMAEVLAEFKPGYVLGHCPANPAVMQKNISYNNVVEELLEYFSRRIDYFVKAGLPLECICLDPCIGFGKNLEHTRQIIQAIPRFAELGRPLYFGISRKAFLGALTGLPVSERDWPCQAATALLALKGIPIHRVHNVKACVATLKVIEGLTKACL